MELKTVQIDSLNCETSSYKNSSGNQGELGFEHYLNEQQNSHRSPHSDLPKDFTIWPTYNNLKPLLSGLSDLLNSFFEQESFDKTSPVCFRFNSEENKVIISGSRSDIEDIDNAINSDADLAGKINTVLTIAEHVCQMPEHLAFQKEYFASNDPEQVLSRYSYLFFDDGSEIQIELKFESGKLDVYYNEKLWEGE